MKAFLRALAGLVLAACASRPSTAAVVSSQAPPPDPVVAHEAPQQPPAPATPEARERRLIARMLKRVELARGLSASRQVPGVVLERTALIQRVKEHVSQELPPEAIHYEGLTLQLLGFVPTDFDYEGAEYRLLEDQLAGYYEPADGTMYMASDLPDDEAEATLAHELVHALQDQRWNLQDRSKYRPGKGDLSEAVSALAEGDATSAMFDVIIARASEARGKTALDLPDSAFAAQIRDSMDRGPGGNAPRIMRASLAAPYLYGTLFVHAMRRRGGWSAVDRVWDDPPTTSEQIMHVDKWLAHEPPLEVAAPSFATLGPGWTIADEDSEGELGARVAFEEWVDEAAAAAASRDWGGDRGVLLVNGDKAAFAWRLRYDRGGPGDARAARSLTSLARGLDTALGPASTRNDTFDCHERADRGPLAVARAGQDLVLLAGPARTSPTGAWAGAATCAVSQKWVKEIAKMP